MTIVGWDAIIEFVYAYADWRKVLGVILKKLGVGLKDY